MTARKPFTVGRHRKVSVITGTNGTAWVSHVTDGAASPRISVCHAPPGGSPSPIATFGPDARTVRLGAANVNVGTWTDAVALAGRLVA